DSGRQWPVGKSVNQPVTMGQPRQGRHPVGAFPYPPATVLADIDAGHTAGERRLRRIAGARGRLRGKVEPVGTRDDQRIPPGHRRVLRSLPGGLEGRHPAHFRPVIGAVDDQLGPGCIVDDRHPGVATEPGNRWVWYPTRARADPVYAPHPPCSLHASPQSATRSRRLIPTGTQRPGPAIGGTTPRRRPLPRPPEVPTLSATRPDEAGAGQPGADHPPASHIFGQSFACSAASVPPSAKSTEPTRNVDSGPSRYAISEAISHGRPPRPTGIPARNSFIPAPTAGSSTLLSVSGVWMKPGATALIRMPSLMYSPEFRRAWYARAAFVAG